MESCKEYSGCLTSNGELITVTATSVEMLKEPERIYNLNVEDFHTYFVGTKGLLVHNDCSENMAKAFDAAVRNAKARGVVDPEDIINAGKKAANMAERIFKNFTVDEMNNLKKLVINEGQALKDMGITNKQLGPAVAGVYNKRTGKFYTAINDVDGKPPIELSPSIKDRIDNMPQEVKDSYTYTYGAGSHAEIYATNKALLDDPLATTDDLLVYVNKTLGTSTPVTEIPFHTCPHCEYILDGFNILSDIL